MTSFLFVFWGFFNKDTANTSGRIFTQNTSNDVVPGKEVPFGGPNNYYIWTLKFPKKTSISGTDFDWICFFATEHRFNMEMLEYKLPLIVIVAA